MELQIPGYASLLITGDGENEVYAINGRLERGLEGVEFLRGNTVRIPLESEWLARAKPVDSELQSIFGEQSQCFIPLSLGSLPEGEQASAFLPTGLNLGGVP